MNERGRAWEQMGAASGLLATLLFVIAFIVFLTTSPGGDPEFPNINHAQFAPAYFTEHLSPVRVVVLLNGLGVALFLWFLASLWTTLRDAEGAPGRGSMIAVTGGVAGSVLVLVGLGLFATAGLSTSDAQSDVVPALYVAASLLIALGGGVYSLFLFGVGKVVLRAGGLARWLGWLAILAAVLSLFGFMTPFFTENILNAATGALGRWAWEIAFVVWVFLASLVMTLEERRGGRAAAPPPPASRPPTPEGAR